jgi:hypothetical protein
MALPAGFPRWAALAVTAGRGTGSLLAAAAAVIDWTGASSSSLISTPAHGIQ